MLASYYMHRAAILSPRKALPRPVWSFKRLFPRISILSGPGLAKCSPQPGSQGCSSRCPVSVPHAAFLISVAALIQQRFRPLPWQNLKPLSLFPSLCFHPRIRVLSFWSASSSFYANGFRYPSETQGLRLHEISLYVLHRDI